MPVSKSAPANTPVTQDEKVMAVFGYLWVLSIFMLIVKKDSAYVLFHARQGFLLFLLSIIFAFLGPLGIVLNVGLALIAIWALLKAWAGQRWELPYLGKWAQKINL